MTLVYDELRKIASRYMFRERPGHTLQTTALVHEAYFRLADQHRVQWRSRAHFFAVASQAMRRILVDHARQLAAAKRGGDQVRVAPEEMRRVPFGISASNIVALDEALFSLGRVDPLKAKLVDLRFFGGLSNEEAAAVLGCSRATAIRQWRMARAWLHRLLLATSR